MKSVNNIRQISNPSVKQTLNARTDNDLYIENYKKEIDNLLSQLVAVAKNGQLSKATAIHFIEKSAWWITHPSGPVRAPGDAKNLEGPENKPILKLGANTFTRWVKRFFLADRPCRIS
ncbi:MAG: hypothetical protein ABIE47_03725 [Pseudomonadota bacterium]